MTAQPTDFTAMAREFRLSLDDGEEYETDAELDAAYDSAVAKFAKTIATLSHAAGHAEGLDDAAVAWNFDMAKAPRDGTLLQLLIKYDEEDGNTGFDDDELTRTMGFNNFDNDGIEEEQWKFPGWSWTHDCILEQGAGTPTAWALMLPLPGQAPAPTPPTDPGLAAQEVERLDSWTFIGAVKKARPETRTTLIDLARGFCLSPGQEEALEQFFRALSAPRPAQTKGPTV